jgi:CAAX protease family protein
MPCGVTDSTGFLTLGLLEVILAIAVAVSAGVCEEIVFRGYFQRQFRALSGNWVIAVVLQTTVFGIAHVYQNVRLASMLVLYGILFGVLELWRRSLRPGIIAHAWSDIAARLLRVWEINGQYTSSERRVM